MVDIAYYRGGGTLPQIEMSEDVMLQKLSERHFNSVLFYGAIAISALVGTALFSALSAVP